MPQERAEARSLFGIAGLADALSRLPCCWPIRRAWTYTIHLITHSANLASCLNSLQPNPLIGRRELVLLGLGSVCGAVAPAADEPSAIDQILGRLRAEYALTINPGAAADWVQSQDKEAAGPTSTMPIGRTRAGSQ